MNPFDREPEDIPRPWEPEPEEDYFSLFLSGAKKLKAVYHECLIFKPFSYTAFKTINSVEKDLNVNSNSSYGGK